MEISPSYSQTAIEAPRDFAQVSGAMTGARAINTMLRAVLKRLGSATHPRVREKDPPAPEIAAMAAAAVAEQTETLALLDELSAILFPVR